MTAIGLGDDGRARGHDLLYVGGGQDREQALIAPDIAAKGPALREAVAGGAAVLAVCGGYQLLGRFYRDRYGARAPRRRRAAAAHGRGRAADDRRRPARVRARAGPARDGRRASRTTPAARSSTRARSRSAAWSPASATTATSGFEGCRLGRAVGTYLHGPLLPRNPWLADWLLAQAVGAPHRRRAARASSRWTTARGRGACRVRGTRARTRRPVLGSDPRRTEAHVASLGAAQLGRPERPEVDGRVAGLPAGEKALDRRVQDDLVELAQPEQPVAANRGVGGGDRLQRPPAEVGREDDVDDVLRRGCARAGEIESTIAIGPSNGIGSSIPTSSSSSRRSASTSDSPEFTPPPGSSQYSFPGFSWRQSRIRSFQRSSADTRMRGSTPTQRCPDEPKPPSPRSLGGQLSTSRSSACGTATTTSWAIRMPGSTTNGSRRVGVVEDHAQLAAVAGVDQPGRVDDRDPVLGGEARARRDEPGMTLRDRDGDARADQRALARGRARGARRRRGRGRRRRGRPGSGRTASSRSRVTGISITRPTRGSGRSAGRPARAAARGSGPRPRGRSRDSIGGPSAYSSASLPPSEYGTSSSTSSKRCAKRSAIRARSSSSPSPVRAETCSATRESGSRAAGAAARRRRRSCSARARSAARPRRSRPAPR